MNVKEHTTTLLKKCWHSAEMQSEGSGEGEDWSTVDDDKEPWKERLQESIAAQKTEIQGWKEL